MAKRCGSCNFRMGTSQELVTFAGNAVASAAVAGLLGVVAGNFLQAATENSHGLTAGLDNTMFASRASCPKCGEVKRWIDD